MAKSELAHDRRALRFDLAVREEFGFLFARGFTELEGTTPTFVALSNGKVTVTVYHGRRSFEIGIEIAQTAAAQGFPLGALIELQDRERGAAYRKFAARTPEAVRRGVADAAKLVAELGAAALEGDPQVFDRLLDQRRRKARDLELDVLAEQLRPKATLAFREKRFGDVVAMLKQIQPRLTPAEQKKLKYAEAALKSQPSSKV